MVEPLNTVARLWWDWSVAMLWQAGLLIVLIGCVDLLIRKWAWPQLRYALWSLILIKLLLPPTLSLPSGIVPELQPVVSQAFRLMNSGEPAGATSDLGCRIADSSLGAGLQSGAIEIPDVGFQPSVVADNIKVADSPLAANPQSAIANPALAWQVHAMMLWLTGTLILGIWLFLRLHSLCGRHAYQAAAASLPQSFYNQMTDCANRLGLRHVPRVVVTKRLASPAVFGAFRPVLLVPKGCLSKLSRRDTEHMLLHELAHVKRGDLIMHGLYMLLQIAYWYNPLLWLVRRQMHHLRELSCDATVANLLRERTRAYRQTLLETARRLLAASVEPGLGLLGLFEDSNRLLVRLNWLTKPTWRYRTMKRAIVVTIAALMIACVLPMAQARESAPNEVKHVTQDEIIRVKADERDQQSQDRLSQDLKALQKHLDQMMVQQKELQNQLQALAERRHEMSSRQEGSREYNDPVSEDLASLQKRLDELTNQQRDLQKQLGALAGERRQLVEQRRQRQRDIAGGGRPRLERVEEDIDVTVSPRESADWERLEREAPEIRDETGRDRETRERLLTEDRKALEKAKQALGEAREAQARVQRQYADRMTVWRAELDQWQKSEQMQKWHDDVAKWGEQMRRWGEEMGRQNESADQPSDGPQMPEMPVMPPMPAPVPNPVPMKMKMDMQIYEDMKTDVRDVYGEGMPAVNGPRVKPPHVGMPAIEPPLPPVPLEVPQDAGNLEEAVCRNGFSPLPGDRFLELVNQVGSITVRSGDEPEYVVRATVIGRAETKERAHEIAERLVEITDTGLQDNGVERIIVSKPEGLRDRESCAVMMEVTVPRNARIKLHQALGDIRLTGVAGAVEAFTQMGSIHAANVAGKVALKTNLGDIEFIVPEEFSAKVQAQTNLGSIESNLPLEGMKRPGLSMGSSVSGTIGGGEGKVSLMTNMGSVKIRSQASEPGRAEGTRREPRPEPKPEPRPEREF